MPHLVRGPNCIYYVLGSGKSQTRWHMPIWYRQLPRQSIARSVIFVRMASTNKTAHPFNKANLEALLNRRFFYAPAFEIYGGACATYDSDMLFDCTF